MPTHLISLRNLLLICPPLLCHIMKSGRLFAFIVSVCTRYSPQPITFCYYRIQTNKINEVFLHLFDPALFSHTFVFHMSFPITLEDISDGHICKIRRYKRIVKQMVMHFLNFLIEIIYMISYHRPKTYTFWRSY